MGNLWDSFLWRIGIMPRNSFQVYAKDTMCVLAAMERFSKSVNTWAKAVSEKIGIVFEKDDVEREKDNSEAGMYR